MTELPSSFVPPVMSDALAYPLELPRQKHLTGNLALNDYVKELAARLGISRITACVALELYRHGVLTYSRNRSHYLARYHSKWSRLHLVRAAFDELAERGLIEHHKKRPSPFNRGRQSWAKILPDLAGVIFEITQGESIPYPSPLEPVVLRGVDGKLTDYKDSGPINRRRKHLQGHAELVVSANIQGCPVTMMERIFNGQWSHGGRAYAPHQNLSKADRLRIQINGEPVVELDYRCIHPSILYALEGLPIPDDSYQIEGISRELAKLVFNVLVCASSYFEAVQAVSSRLENDDRQRAHQIIDVVAKRHKPIKDAFYRGAWAELQGRDSDMAETVWWQLTKMGIPCLPVHDSFIVPKSASGVLSDTMKSASEMWAGAPLEIA